MLQQSQQDFKYFILSEQQDRAMIECIQKYIHKCTTTSSWSYSYSWILNTILLFEEMRLLPYSAFTLYMDSSPFQYMVVPR